MEQPNRAFAFKDFCIKYGISRSTGFREMRAGRLKAIKRGRSLLILAEDAEAWVNALPERNHAA